MWAITAMATRPGTISPSRGSSPRSPLLEKLRRLDCEIREHAVGAGALESKQRFQNHAWIEPAAFDRALQHRIFPAHLISEGRHAETLLHAPDDVEIGQAGLDHDHVGAFGDVERNLAQRLVAIGRIHLIAALVGVAECALAGDRVAERAVETR